MSIVQQVHRMPNSAVPGSSHIVVHPDCASGFPTGKRDTHASNVFGMLKNTVKATPDKPFLGIRTYDRSTNKYGGYEWMSYAQAYARVLNIGSGLVHLIKRHSRPEADISQITRLPLGLYSTNRAEWVLADFGGVSQNFYSVALYDTLGADSVEFIVNHAEIEILVCSLDKIPKLLAMRRKLPNLKAIVSMDNLSSETPDAGLPSPFNTSSVATLKLWANAVGIALYDLHSVESIGAADAVYPREPLPDDVFCFCYTSGTTGTPKGAMILHRNLEFVQKSLEALFDIDGEVVALSYLPLAHIYERFVEIFIMSVGGQIGFFSNILNVVADMQTLKPSMFMSVPRLLNRIFDSVAAITIYAPGIRGAIARRAVADKVANMQAGKGNTHTVWDRVVFKKVRDILGGNVQLINTGSAPIEKKVLEFLRVAFCCHVSEGWGQTESTGYGIVTVKGETVGLRVGIPQYGVEVKLMDIPDMDYLVTDKPFPRGELMVRGGLVFGGYYKDQEKTDQTILEGGWLATGDVAQFNADGTISIIDRKKSIFKLSQGEYVAPENLENIFTNNLLILQMFVHGDSLQSTLVSVIVPDPDKFVPWARKIIGNNGASFEELCKSLQVTTAMHKVIMEDAKRAKLQGYEIPKALKLEHRPFDIEGNQILTPTFKLKRNVAAEYYRKDIDQMYASLTK